MYIIWTLYKVDMGYIYTSYKVHIHQNHEAKYQKLSSLITHGSLIIYLYSASYFFSSTTTIADNSAK